MHFFIAHISKKKTVPKMLRMSLHKACLIDSLHLMMKKDEVILHMWDVYQKALLLD